MYRSNEHTPRLVPVMKIDLWMTLDGNLPVWSSCSPLGTGTRRSGVSAAETEGIGGVDASNCPVNRLALSCSAGACRFDGRL